MITQTYTFRDLPKGIRENENGRRDSFIKGIQLDIAAEFEGALFPPKMVKSEMDVTGYDLIIAFAVEPEDARFLEIALHNLHQGKLLN